MVDVFRFASLKLETADASAPPRAANSNVMICPKEQTFPKIKATTTSNFFIFIKMSYID